MSAAEIREIQQVFGGTKLEIQQLMTLETVSDVSLPPAPTPDEDRTFEMFQTLGIS